MRFEIVLKKREEDSHLLLFLLKIIVFNSKNLNKYTFLFIDLKNFYSLNFTH